MCGLYSPVRACRSQALHPRALSSASSTSTCSSTSLTLSCFHAGSVWPWGMFRFVPASKAQTDGKPLMCIRTGDFLCRKVYMFTSAAGPPLCTLCAGGENPASLHYVVAIFGRHREHRKGDKFLYFFAHTNASRQNRMGTHGHKRKSEGINSDNLVSALTGVDIAVRVARSQHPHSIVQFPASTSACRKPQTGAAASVGPGAAASIKILKEILALHDHACRAAACALPRNAVPS